MTMAECGSAELQAVRSRFSRLARDWGLDPIETAALLGLPPPSEGVDPLEAPFSTDAETRMRLLIEAARELDALFGAQGLVSWLRDDEDGDVTPLAFMSRGVQEIRAMRSAASAGARS